MKITEAEKKKVLGIVSGCVPWNTLEYAMKETFGDTEGERLYREFGIWMNGQTQCEFGVYTWDLEAFLRGCCEGRSAPVYD